MLEPVTGEEATVAFDVTAILLGVKDPGRSERNRGS
jgi:hypothetical protein